MIFVKRLTGKYERTARAAIRLIERVEERFGFDSCIEGIYCRPTLSVSACYYTRDHHRLPGIIRVPCLPPRSRMLKEFVFHELGHALLDHYRIRSALKKFTRRKSEGWRYYFDTWRFAKMPRKEGFVSGYAEINAEEDFCETLAACLCNLSLERMIVFNSQWINVRHDTVARRKIAATSNLLRSL